ncbi:MAG: pyridoxal phosphate-dependent aminotransferase [Bacteroidota bacterium]
MPALTDLNPRVAAMQPSATMAISGRAKELKRQGRPVIALSAGEPDFPTPRPVCEAAVRAIRDGHHGYTANPGMADLREAIAEKLRRDNGLTYDPATEIVCCSGGKQAIAETVLAVCRPGDEVLVPAPFWVSYPEQARLAGATPVIVDTSPADGYLMSPEALEAAITDKTRLLVFNSPSNPTGAVYSPDQIEAIAMVLRRHPHVLVLSDEIYEYVVYDAEHASIAACEGMRDRTIVVNGHSKGFAMTGWRLGYLAAPAWIAKACAKIQGQFTSAPCVITQHAGLAAYRMHADEPNCLDGMIAAFRRRRDYVLGRLRAMPGVTCPTPEGAFYVFPDISAHLGKNAPTDTVINDSTALCLYLLEHHNVAAVPGTAFGAPYGLRLSYAASDDDLRVALDRIEMGLNELG